MIVSEFSSSSPSNHVRIITEYEVQEIRELCGATSSQFSTFRRILLDRGLVDDTDYGYLKLSLPRFSNFIANMLRW